MAEFLRSFAARERWMGVVRAPAFRRAVAGILLFVIFIKVALPLFVSTANVKDNMEAALSRWTGARATIGGTARISFWPGPTLTLADVRFDTEDGGAPLATAKAISADFDLLAALSGRPIFYDFHLLEPVLTVRRGEDGMSNWPVPLWMGRAIAAEAGAGSSAPAGEPIGDIVIDNGTLDLQDASTGRDARFERIFGTIGWRTPTARLTADMKATVHGEAVELSVTCDAPMALLAGREGGLQASLGSAPLDIRFDGKGTGGRYPGINGTLQANAPSAAGLARWFGLQTPVTAASWPLSIEATVSSTANSIKMDDLVLSVAGANATGLLDLSLPPHAKPKINGTLAFDRLDAEGLAMLFPFPPPSDNDTPTRLLDRIDLDLRLSAQTASYASLTLTDLAAGIMAGGGKASLDIGDSGYAGGSLNGRLAVLDGGARGGEMQVSLKDTDLNTLAGDLGLQGPMLQGQGTLSLDLSTRKPLTATSFRDMSGSVRFSGGRGTLTHFDADTFQRLVAEGHFFDSKATTGSGFPTQSSEIVARLQDGVATLEKAEIRGEQKSLILTGVIPFHTNGLALAGSLTTNDGSAPAARFFAGGSWPNAVISPLSTLPDQP